MPENIYDVLYLLLLRSVEVAIPNLGIEVCIYFFSQSISSGIRNSFS